MSDYISREAAMAVIEGEQKKLCPVGLWGRKFAADADKYDILQEMLDKLEAIPAADVEPVRHSYWESYDTSQYMGTDEFGEPKWRPGRFYICHERRCRRKTVVKSNYCPNCGCKMDLEE